MRYQMLTGHFDRDYYNEAVFEVVSYLDAEGKDRAHLAEFLEAWRQEDSTVGRA
jgi:hypothetical protein